MEARVEETRRHFEETVAPTRCAKQRRTVGAKAGELAVEILAIAELEFGARLLNANTVGNEAAAGVLARRIVEVDRLDAGGKATEIRRLILAYPECRDMADSIEKNRVEQ